MLRLTPEQYARRSKYRNIRTELDGRVFDSKKEAARYQELKLLEKSGQICNLECQPEYELRVNGELICKYRGDFKYTKNGDEVCEDVKSAPTKTPAYRIKKRLMRAIHGIEIYESGMRK